MNIFKIADYLHLCPQNILQYFVARNIDGEELTDEKIRDFKRVVLAQVAIIFSLFLLAVFETMEFHWRIEIAESIFFATLGVYCFLLWDMLRNYASSRRVIIVNFIFIMGVFLFGVVGVNPFYPMAHAVLAGSPAVDAGSNPGAFADDQRGAGFARESGAGADIGAYERQVDDDETFYGGFDG